MLMPASDEVITGFFKGLGDATRLKIVELLLERERNVSELSKILQVPQSNISNHVASLRWCGCITSHKERTSVYYRIRDQRVHKIMKLARAIIADYAGHKYAFARTKN